MTIDGDMALKLATFAISVGAALYAWVISQGKAYEPKLRELSERLDRKAERLARLETEVQRLGGEMSHLPDKDMVHRIELGMKDMQSRIEAQAEVVKAVERTMQRVETFLLEAQNRPVSRTRGK